MDEETRYQILIAVSGVVVFIVAAVVVGMMYGQDGGAVTAMTPTGGLALVGTVALFILVMAGLGVWLERQEFES
jgi:hypothetical protein